ncbi:hypothetical protein [Abyssisolibacter fermentans]|uniref:hypothetical protein n=1 Tax=Abyssisolibacter fermentans TaxID=1766203 RepID=UPI00082950D1|nr:hypothetical protein [Abyssisolibacter fermentans]
MIKRNLVFIIVISILSLLFISCSNENNEIQSLIEKTEILDSKFSCYEIGYDEYMKEIKDIYSSTYTDKKHLKRIFPNPEIDKEYYIDVYENGMGEKIKYTKIVECKTQLKISKVYDIKDNTKTIYTKTKIEFEDKDFGKDGPLIIEKKYYILKEGNKWRITGADSKYYNEKDIKKYGNKLIFKTINDKPVEYIETIDPLTAKHSIQIVHWQ